MEFHILCPFFFYFPICLCLYYFLESSRSSCVDLYCSGVCVGLIKPSVLPHLLLYKDVFVPEEVDGALVRVRLSDNLSSVEERTKSVNDVFKDLQSKNIFSCLRGWRNEVLLGKGIFLMAMQVLML